MASRNLKRAAESPNTPRPSNFRRKDTETSGDDSDSKLRKVEEEDFEMGTPPTQTSASMDIQEEASMAEGSLPATPEQEEEDWAMATPEVPRTAAARVSTPEANMFNTPEPRTSSDTAAGASNTPIQHAFSMVPPQKGPSTLRRKTKGLFLSKNYSSSNPFDPDDDEYDQVSPSLHTKELKQKANNLFTGYREPKNVLDSDADMDSSPIHQTLRGRATKSINSPPNRRPKPSASFTSSPMRMDVDDEVEAESSDARKMSTLRMNSAALFGEKKHSSNSIWDADDEEFALDLGSMRLDGSGRVRSSAARSMRASLASSFRSTPSQDDKNVGKSNEQVSAPAGRSPYLGTPSGTDKKDLEKAVHSFVEHRGTFKGIPHIKSHRFEAKQDVSKSTTPVRGENLTDQQRDDYMHELMDKNCGNPKGIDAHDEVMKQFYYASRSSLPVEGPSNHPHLLDYKSYTNDLEGDAVVRLARPRLADAVATVLYQTSPKCLADFLNPEVQVFEWRRDGNCVMIRREGNEVVVGTFSNFGTTYLWPLFVRSKISEDGAWEEIYAGAAMIKTPVTAEGVQFDQFVEEGERIDEVDPTNEKYALHMGRILGRFLVEWTVWDFRQWRRWGVSWEADGMVTDAKEHGHEALKMLRDLE